MDADLWRPRSRPHRDKFILTRGSWAILCLLVYVFQISARCEGTRVGTSYLRKEMLKHPVFAKCSAVVELIYCVLEEGLRSFQPLMLISVAHIHSR